MLKRTLAGTVICLFAATAVVSAAGMHEDREAAMKKIGGSMGALAAIVKGKGAL